MSENSSTEIGEEAARALIAAGFPVQTRYFVKPPGGRPQAAPDEPRVAAPDEHRVAAPNPRVGYPVEAGRVPLSRIQSSSAMHEIGKAAMALLAETPFGSMPRDRLVSALWKDGNIRARMVRQNGLSTHISNLINRGVLRRSTNGRLI